MLSVKFATRRAQASRAVQATFNGALESVKSIESWDEDLAGLEKLITSERRKRAQWRSAARRWQETMNQIQALARNVKVLGKLSFRNNPVRLELVSRLRTDGRSRTAIRQEGQAAHALWREAFPEWKVFGEVAVEELGRLLKLAASREGKHLASHTAWRNAVTLMMAKARELDRACKGWFMIATGRFPAGTVQGNLIFTRVPTTTRPRRSRAKHAALIVKLLESPVQLPLVLPPGAACA